MLVALAACSKKGPGESCGNDADCQSGYLCFRGSCMTYQTRDHALNAQSGVGKAPVERPVVGGEPVRVRTTQGEGTIFAACEASERLIGGGCNGGQDCESESSCHFLRSFPANYRDNDTLGARWVCSGARGTMQAFALCQATPPKTAPGEPAPPSAPEDAAVAPSD